MRGAEGQASTPVFSMGCWLALDPRGKAQIDPPRPALIDAPGLRLDEAQGHKSAAAQDQRGIDQRV